MRNDDRGKGPRQGGPKGGFRGKGGPGAEGRSGAEGRRGGEGGRPGGKKAPYGTFKGGAFKGAKTRPYTGKPAVRSHSEGDGSAEKRSEGGFRPGKPDGFRGRPAFKGGFPGGRTGGGRGDRDDGVIASDPTKRGFRGPKSQGDRREGQPWKGRPDDRRHRDEQGGRDRPRREPGPRDRTLADRSEQPHTARPGGAPFHDREERRTRHDRRPRNERSPFRSRGRGRDDESDDRKGARQASTAGPSEPMRIAKAMARAGLCSRREAERWIMEGRVSVNGKVLGSPAVEVGPRDKVVVDGQPLPEAEGVRLWRYHKPRGLVTTHHDPEGRPTVFDNLPPDLPRVISIGRLDFNTEGLLLLTNDGELARYLELPATGWLRRYRVRARGRVTQAQLDALKEGVSIEGVNYGPVEASLDSEQGANIWLTVGLREGKNREIRKILGSLGLEVSRLIRVSFGPFQLLDLEAGSVDRVRRRTLREQLGPKIARDLGLIEGTEPQEKPKGGEGREGRKPWRPDITQDPEGDEE